MKRFMCLGLIALAVTALTLQAGVHSSSRADLLVDLSPSQMFLPLVIGGRGTAPPPEPDVRIDDLIWDTSDEQLILTNHGAGAQDMTGWQIHSVVGDQWYLFPSGYELAPDATAYIHSGPDAYSAPPTHLLWATLYIWNNFGDEAIVYDQNGLEVDSYCYGDGCP